MKRRTNGHKPATSGLTRAVIYRRTSSERQGEKVSPESQLADAEAYAKARGYTVVGVYTDIERYRVRGRLVEPSGSRADRPEFLRLIADGQAGLYDIIVAWKEDRLYRGIKPAVIVDDLIESAGVTVELVKENFDRKMLFIKAGIARLELESIKERTEMGKIGRAQSGLHHGGRVPHGYRAVKDTFGTVQNYELVPEWRGFFDDLARLFLERVPYYDLAQRLPLNPRTGRPWPASTIRYFLMNPFYRGKLAYGWNTREPDFVVKGRQAPAWDAETIEAIDRELARRHHNHWGPRGTGAWSTIVRCGICGHTLATNNARQVTRQNEGHTLYRMYGCSRPNWVKQGLWPGPTHEPNFISERKLTALVRELFADASPADIEAYLDALVLPDQFGQGDLEQQARAEAEAARLEGKLADLAVGLEGVRHASPAATEALVAEIRRTGQLLDTRRAELASLARHKSAAPDLTRARMSLLRLASHPELFDQSTDDLAPILREALPALYVKGGALVPPVEPWPRPEWRSPRKKKPAH